METIRSFDAFVNASTGLLKDNSAGDISAQDLRDFVASVFGSRFAVSKSADYTVAQGDEVVLVDASGGPVTITLPAVAGAQHFAPRIMKTDNTANAVTVQPDAGDGSILHDRINGAGASQKLYLQGDFARWISDGAAWWMIQDGLIPHAAGAERAVAQSIPNTTTTQIQIDTVRFNRGMTVDIATNFEIVVVRAGVYALHGGLRLDNQETNNLQINGSNSIRHQLGSITGVGTAMPTNGLRSLGAGDSIRLATYHSNGSSQNTQTVDDSVKPILIAMEVR